MSKRVKEILSSKEGREQLGKMIISGCENGLIKIDGKEYKFTCHASYSKK